MPGLDKITVGTGTDMVMSCSSNVLEQIAKNVSYVHDVTVKRSLPDFIYPQKARKASNKRCRFDPSGKWTPKKYAEVDLALSNHPDQGRKVSQLLLNTLKYWEDNVIPHLLMNKKGQADKFLRAAVICVTRCCIPGSLLPGITTQAEKKFVDSIDRCICDTLFNTHPREGPGDESVPSHEIGEEAIDTLSRTIYRHWKSAYASSRTNVCTTSRKFGSVIAFVRAWRKIAEVYEAYPVHKERDVNLRHIAVNGGTWPVLGCGATTASSFDSQFLYPVNTAATVIVGDYLFKLLAELVLSPHINVEWKISMCMFIEKDAKKMLAMLEPDISRAATDITNDFQCDQVTCGYGSQPIKQCFNINGTRCNPTQILPRASNFWDFCRGGSPPSDVRYCMVFNEPSTSPRLSSGAGLFGFFTSSYSMEDDNEIEVQVALRCLTGLLGLDDSGGSGHVISTRRWREEGTVVCFNFCPITVSGAVLGYGEQMSKGMKAGYWLKAVQRSITDSVSRRRNAADKSSRMSDLLSDGGSISIKTVTFGCSEMLKPLTGVSTFDIVVSYQNSVQSNAPGADRLYALQRVVSHSFPALF